MSNGNVNGKNKTLGERVGNWAKAISVLAATGIAVYAALQGGATWDVLQAKVDRQSQTINSQSNAIAEMTAKLGLMVARDEGRTEGKLMRQLDELKEELERTKAKKLVRAASTAALRKLIKEQQPKPAPSPKPKPRPKHPGKMFKPTFQRLSPLPTSPFSKSGD